MIISDTAKKRNNSSDMEQQEAEEKEAFAEQQKQLKREQLAMLDSADLINRFQ